MKLIKIESNVIGNGAVNSVNSREIHSQLKVKTKYADWIKRAIDKYGFEENEDFSILKNGNGSNAFLDYIVTLDMAKELCMLDDSEMGKMYRRYFIQVEKEAINTKPMVSREIMLLAQGYQLIENKVDDIKTDVELLKNDIVLTPSQKRILQKSVSQKVYSFNAPQESNKKLFSKIYSKLKDRFAVSSYMEIQRLKFDEAKSMIDNISLIDLV